MRLWEFFNESASSGATSSGAISTAVDGKLPDGSFFGGDPSSSIYGPIKKHREDRKKEENLTEYKKEGISVRKLNNIPKGTYAFIYHPEVGFFIKTCNEYAIHGSLFWKITDKYRFRNNNRIPYDEWERGYTVVNPYTKTITVMPTCRAFELDEKEIFEKRFPSWNIIVENDFNSSIFYAPISKPVNMSPSAFMSWKAPTRIGESLSAQLLTNKINDTSKKSYIWAYHPKAGLYGMRGSYSDHYYLMSKLEDEYPNLKYDDWDRGYLVPDPAHKILYVMPTDAREYYDYPIKKIFTKTFPKWSIKLFKEFQGLVKPTAKMLPALKKGIALFCRCANGHYRKIERFYENLPKWLVVDIKDKLRSNYVIAKVSSTNNTIIVSSSYEKYKVTVPKLSPRKYVSPKDFIITPLQVK